MAGGVNAPFLDDEETWAPTFSTPPGVYAPFLESGIGFAPTVGGESTVGLVVKVGATVLAAADDRSFLDELAGPGSFSLSLPNDDPDMPAPDDVITFEVGGVPRFAGVFTDDHVVTYAPGEGIAEVTTIKGAGALSLWNRTVVQPSRGWDAFPMERTRSWFWGSFDFDDTAWPASKRIRRSDVPTALPPNRYSPEWWPDKGSYWVWADRPDVSETSAPGGRCLFRSAPGVITLAADETLAIFSGQDNFGTVYFDGAEVMDTENDASSYTIGRRVQIEATAGEHVLAANILNTGRGGGWNWTIWTVDAEGLLDTLVAHSDSTTTLCLPYPFPDNPPTVTAGWVLRQILEEAQAEDELLDWTLDCTDTLDSDGEPWIPVAEVTAEVGRRGCDLLEALMDWLFDAQRAPGANVLRAWNWGTRGGTPDVTIVATPNRNASEVESLVHDGRSTRVNRLRIAYGGGYTTAEDASSITAHEARTDFLDLSDVRSESTAKGIGTREIARRKQPSYAHSLQLAPAVDEDTGVVTPIASVPYDKFDNGDYVTHPDQAGAATLSRVRSIAVGEDDVGNLIYGLRLNDIRQETQDRHENWLKRKAMGALAGGARVSSRSGEGLEPAVRISTTNVAEFSFDTPTDGVITGKRPADSSGNLIEIYVEVSTDDDAEPSSETVVEVWQYIHGTTTPTSIGTVTVPAGETIGETDLEASKVFRNIYKYRAEVVTVGGGVTGVDVQLRAI